MRLTPEFNGQAAKPLLDQNSQTGPSIEQSDNYPAPPRSIDEQIQPLF